jgi:hypothetical protein
MALAAGEPRTSQWRPIMTLGTLAYLGMVLAGYVVFITALGVCWLRQFTAELREQRRPATAPAAAYVEPERRRAA